jgi:hypothetical protein
VAYNVIGLSVCPENRRTKNRWKLPKMPETVKSTPHQNPRIKSTTTTKGTGDSGNDCRNAANCEIDTSCSGEADLHGRCGQLRLTRSILEKPAFNYGFFRPNPLAFQMASRKNGGHGCDITG